MRELLLGAGGGAFRADGFCFHSRRLALNQIFPFFKILQMYGPVVVLLLALLALLKIILWVRVAIGVYITNFAHHCTNQIVRTPLGLGLVTNASDDGCQQFSLKM
jgi:hypothetical protein